MISLRDKYLDEKEGEHSYAHKAELAKLFNILERLQEDVVDLRIRMTALEEVK